MNKYAKLLIPIIIAVFIALIPIWVKSPYYLDILIMAGVNLTLAISFILALRSGLVNVAVQVFWGIGAYASVILVIKAGLPFWLSMPLAAIIVGLISYCLSFLILRTIGFQFIIFGFVISMLFVVAIGNIKFLGGFSGISLIPPPNAIKLPFIAPIEFTSKVEYFYLMLFLVVLVIVIYMALYNSSFGDAWKAIGLNPYLAETLGINTFKYRTLAFVIANATCGLIGAFYAHYQGYITPTAFGLFKGLYVAMYAILGGVEHVFLGPVFGTMIMMALPEIFRIIREFEPIITSILIIIIILFLPKGILSLPGLRSVVADPLGQIRKLATVIKSNTWLTSRDKAARK